MSYTISNTIKDELEQAKEIFEFTWPEVAHVFNATERTIHRWRKGESKPFPAYQKRLQQMDDLLDLMNEFFQNREYIRDWLHKKVPALQNRRPINMLKQGRIEEVYEVLGRAVDGILS